ncbi:MAG: four helix bundle suffix domain-containing protein [bacterium]
MSEGSLLRGRGDYHNLLTFQKATVVYDLTYYFCEKYLRRGDRTIDQMVQAARSGKQNIVEGCVASATSKETEIKLTNVAKASLEELLVDYEDYLRTRKLHQWDKISKEAVCMRELGKRETGSDYYLNLAQTRPDEVVANMTICLIHQTTYLLRKQVEHLGELFLKEGGLRERMTRMRLEERKK